MLFLTHHQALPSLLYDAPSEQSTETVLVTADMVQNRHNPDLVLCARCRLVHNHSHLGRRMALPTNHSSSGGLLEAADTGHSRWTTRSSGRNQHGRCSVAHQLHVGSRQDSGALSAFEYLQSESERHGRCDNVDQGQAKTTGLSNGASSGTWIRSSMKSWRNQEHRTCQRGIRFVRRFRQEPGFGCTPTLNVRYCCQSNRKYNR